MGVAVKCILWWSPGEYDRFDLNLYTLVVIFNSYIDNITIIMQSV